MRLPLYATALWLLFCCPIGALAQQSGQAPASVDDAPRDTGRPRSAVASGADGVEQVQPETFVLPDAQGNLLSMPNWTYEEFMRIWSSREEGPRPAREPTYSLQRLECVGQVEGADFVRLQADLEIRLQENLRTRVPLAFPTGILGGYEIASKDKDAYIHFDDDLNEHVLWVSGDPGNTCEVSLEVLLPITRIGKLSVLKFYPPRAAKSSRLTLDLEGGGVQVEGRTANTHVTTSQQDGKTQIIVAGLAETTEFAWWAVEQRGAQNARKLAAQSQIQIRAEQGVVRTEVSLAVEKLLGEIDRFRIRLPAGERLVSQNVQQGALVRIGDATTESGGPAGAAERQDEESGGVYEVRLAEPQQLPFEMELVTERPMTFDEDARRLPLAGVEVVGAASHQGMVRLVVSEDLRVRWEEGRHVRQVATPDDQAAAGATASFQFDSGDWQLPVILAARRTEVSVVPVYDLKIGSDGLVLTATFRYSVQGTMRGGLRYALAGWELADDPIGPDSTIRRSSVFVDNTGIMYLSLEPVEGSFETTLPLRMAGVANSNLMRIRLPECLVKGSIQEGRLIVRGEASLEVIPQVQASRGLLPRSRSLPAEGLVDPSEDMAQEYRVSSLPAEFLAVVRRRTRTIDNQSRITAEIHSDHVLVNQECRIDVQNVPANELVFRAPPEMAANPSTTFALDGQSVAPSWEDPPIEAGPVDWRVARIVLEQPQMGSAMLAIRYQAPLAREREGSGVATQPTALPLAVPEADSHQLVVALVNHTSDAQVQLRPPEGLESASANGPYPIVNPDERSSMVIGAPLDALQFDVRPAATTSQRTLVVDQAWIQTLIVGDSMRTRTAMRLVPSTDRIVLEFGNDASTEILDVWINGDSVESLLVADSGAVALSTSELAPGASCVVEVFQQSPFAQHDDGTVQVAPPRIAGARGYNNVYWQMILPQSLHAFCASQEFVSDSPWTFQGAYWARVPAMSEGELVDLIGVERAHSLPASSHELLMVGFEMPRVLAAKLVRRSTIVLWVSGGILAAGFVFLYVRRLQRWEVVVAAIVAVASTGIIYPDLSPFILQAGALGAALVLVAIFLKRLMGQRQTTAGARLPADTSTFYHESPPPADAAQTPTALLEPASSAPTLVHSLTDSGVQHPA